MRVFKNKKALSILILYMSATLFGIEVALPVGVVAILLLGGGKYRSIGITRFPGIKEYSVLIILGIIVGLLQVASQNHILREYIKHIAYVCLPVIYLQNGVIIGKSNENNIKQKALSGLFYSGVLFCVYDLINSFIKIVTNSGGFSSLYQFRSLVGTGTQYGVYTLFLGVCFNEYIRIPKHKKMIYAILVIEILIHFSRSSILLTVLFLFIIFKSGFRFKYIKYIAALLIAVVAVYFVAPSMFGELLAKFANSFSEISINRSVWNQVDIIQNWRGYEAYKALERFNGSDVIAKMLGTGFGTQLDVGEYARLVTTENALSYLHNGFFTILIVWGVIGEILYAIMIIKMYRRLPYGQTREKSYMQVMVLALIINTLFMHGPAFSGGGAFLFLYYGFFWGLK